MVIKVLNVSFELLCNKFRNHTAGKLKGDVTDEKCPQLIVSELDDIKTKLDGLARKDLLASISFLKEGVCLLNQSLDTARDHGALPFAQEHKKDVAEAEGLTMVEASDSNDGRNSVFTEALALPEAIKRFRITSPKSLTSALSSFKAAREEATRAFSNETLSTEDRILAAKLRVISRILESLDDPDAAAVACKVYLEELHDMPAVKKMFAVQFKGGAKSRFYKTWRAENVKSVFLINFVLYNFLKKFTTKAAYLDLFNWPQIDHKKISMHPMLLTAENDIIKEIEESGVQAPNVISIARSSFSYVFAINIKKGEIIAWEKPSVVLVNSKGDVQDFCRLPKEDTEASGFDVCAMASDVEDNVYIVTMSKQTHNSYCYKLFVYDTNGKIKQQSPLEFLNGSYIQQGSFNAAVNKDKNIIISCKVLDERRIFVCDNSGQLKYTFPVEYWIEYLSISHKNEIITAKYEGDTVYIYTEEGELKQTFKVPEGHKVLGGVAFDHINEKIIVCTWYDKVEGYCLLNYSDIDKKPQILSLHSLSNPTIISHPNAPVALVHDRGIIFI